MGILWAHMGAIGCIVLPVISVTTHNWFFQMTGRVNYDTWNNIVGYTVDDMRIKYEFPSRPNVSSLLIILVRVKLS